MKISLIGLGYVGAVSLACLSRDGHEVTGVDINDTKLQLIRDDQSPIIEGDVLELMKEVVESGLVAVTNSAKEAIERTDLSFVCVGTPLLANGNQNVDDMIRLFEQIGPARKSKPESHAIVIRSTVQPGTVESIVITIPEKHSGKRVGEKYFVCLQPEFLREGSSISDCDNPPMAVVGSKNSVAIRRLKDLFGSGPHEFIQTDIRTAETLKYACNTFHALKIIFANEIGRLCQALDSDSHCVMQLL